MKTKLFLFSMLTVCLFIFVNASGDNKSSGRNNHKAVSYNKLIGDAYVADIPHNFSDIKSSVNNPNWEYAPVINHSSPDLPVTFSVTELDTNGRTLYDLQSNGIIHYIVQDTANPLKMYACF